MLAGYCSDWHNNSGWFRLDAFWVKHIKLKWKYCIFVRAHDTTESVSIGPVMEIICALKIVPQFLYLFSQQQKWIQPLNFYNGHEKITRSLKALSSCLTLLWAMWCFCIDCLTFILTQTLAFQRMHCTFECAQNSINIFFN